MLILLIPAESIDETASDEAKRGNLREKALTASYDEYKELTGAWRSLDTKAQGNITVAGIFIAGAFAYLTKVSPQPGIAEKVLFVFAIIFLVISVVLSILVLQIRDVPPHYLGGFMRTMVRDLEDKTAQEFKAYSLSFYNLHANRWDESSKNLTSANKHKGDFLWAAQIFLIIAIFTAAILVILKMLS